MVDLKVGEGLPLDAKLGEVNVSRPDLYQNWLVCPQGAVLVGGIVRDQHMGQLGVSHGPLAHGPGWNCFQRVTAEKTPPVERCQNVPWHPKNRRHGAFASGPLPGDGAANPGKQKLPPRAGPPRAVRPTGFHALRQACHHAGGKSFCGSARLIGKGGQGLPSSDYFPKNTGRDLRGCWDVKEA